MPQTQLIYSISFIAILLSLSPAYSSATITEEAILNVNKDEVTTKQQKLRLQKTAGLLAEYEIEAKKLIDSLEEGADSQQLSNKAKSLLNLSEVVIESARFRLPQCDEYLSKTLQIKSQIVTISHNELEIGYHQDKALPKASGECYHTKDLFIHPATVMVLTRDDPQLANATKDSIKAEINEVLAHTEIVRQLVIY